MDSDRPPPPPHRTTSTSSTSDLFICFTARHHSSMKISSKSSLSPGRAGTSRDPPISLSTSLSRRLRTSRSIKGGASPAMFPTTTGKKRTGGFENPEPSSPKVTCIGQVRVKSKKKHGKRLRTLSRRHSTGDVSFRKLDHSRDGFSRSQKLGPNYQQGGGSNSFGSSNQDNLPEQRNNPNPRWVHLPLTICEALRAFGSEFSCLFPCRSSCFSPATEREKEEKTAAGGDRQSSGSCAAVFTRWLVAFQDGDDGGRGGGREIELVVGDDDDDDDDEEDEEIRTSRRHVFDDLEIVNDRIEGSKDEGRMSICIPPKNALLLMRCRSDPLKMEALANRLWEPTIGDYEEEEDDEDENFIEYEDQIPLKEVDSNESKAFHQETNEENQETNEEDLEKEEESTFFGSLFEEIVDQDLENVEMEEELFEEEEIPEIPETEMESNFEKVKGFEEEMVVTQFGDRSEEMVRESKESKEREAVGVLEREGLPECLLLMMCEPKLSMEVSKETWVSSKDFIRRHSSRKKPPPPQPPLPPSLPVKPPTGQDESKVSAATTTTTITTTLARATRFHNHVTAEDAASAVAPIQPGRSSCSLPAPPSMAEMLEQKLVNAVGYEPFVLTRCKSEPMRTAAAKLAPDSCFWKNRKLEPLRRASFGVGAAGVGF